MSLSQTQKGVIAAIFFGLSGFIIYNSFFKSSIIISEGEFSTEIDSDSQEIIDLAEEFENMTVNTVVFSSPLFISLKDAGSSVSQEIQGKEDPFVSF